MKFDRGAYTKMTKESGTLVYFLGVCWYNALITAMALKKNRGSNMKDDFCIMQKSSLY